MKKHEDSRFVLECDEIRVEIHTLELSYLRQSTKIYV
jgi:hypothetical protein